MDNVKLWLTGRIQIKDEEIITINDAIKNKSEFGKYKIIKWDFSINLNDQQSNELLNYLENGGSIFEISKASKRNKFPVFD